MLEKSVITVFEAKDLLTEDNDVKIAGAKFAAKPDDAELSATEFQRQKSNGNIDKAYELGNRLSQILFTTDDILAVHCCKKYAADKNIRINAQILYVFMAVTVLENSCPDSTTAKTAINYFHKCVKEKSPELYNTILESGAFSLYLLCIRDAKMASNCIGNTFAESCDMENDSAIIKIGDKLYNTYLNICRDELLHINFAL